MKATDPGFEAWLAAQLAKAPDPSVDPERCAKPTRLLGLTRPTDVGHEQSPMRSRSQQTTFKDPACCGTLSLSSPQTRAR